MQSDTSDDSNAKREAWVPDMADSAIRLSIPVTIILERRIISRSFWSLPSWYLNTVAVGESLIARQDQARGKGAVVQAGSTDKGDLFAWSGYEVTLYKDACERYWHALIGDKPLIYVVCRDDSEQIQEKDSRACGMTPLSVTIDYDAASAAAETDSPVLSASIPGELYRVMERFVLTHYRPQEFKKRKRRDWSEDQRPAADGGHKSGAGHD